STGLPPRQRRPAAPGLLQKRDSIGTLSRSAARHAAAVPFLLTPCPGTLDTTSVTSRPARAGRCENRPHALEPRDPPPTSAVAARRRRARRRLDQDRLQRGQRLPPREGFHPREGARGDPAGGLPSTGRGAAAAHRGERHDHPRRPLAGLLLLLEPRPAVHRGGAGAWADDPAA